MVDDTIAGEIIGCDNLNIAKVTADTSSAYTTGAVRYLAPVGEIKEDEKATVNSSPYDNVVMFHYASEGASEITLTIPGLTEREAAELVGKPYDSAKGVILDNGDYSKQPVWALGFRVRAGSTTNTFYKYRWFLKGRFVFSATTAKTAGEKIDQQSQEVTFYPEKTIHKWTFTDSYTTDEITDGLKIIKTDTTDEAFTTETSWFSQVQTPDTIGAPTALALSSIVPAAAATGVLASANVVLTFNNAIDTHSVKLVDDVTDSIVPAAYTFDSTYKILTINPTSNMTAGDKHAVAIFSVKDVYGQSLTDSLSYFTVAS